ncbi:MAG: PDZ domain-containing protein [Acidobacteria bacterium]|jgi:predicted metalloprotease with PDZ domain|nr:PDZ domain-containing protein [Acidobacteriota bacterium]
MRKVFSLLIVVLILAMPALAGEKGKCNGNPEDCMKKMKAKYAEKAWLGIEYDTDESGHWVVKDVYDKSPAQKAGFQKGDIMLAVNDVKYSKDNKPKLKEVYAKFEPGSDATYWVKRNGEKVKLHATLGSVPKDVQKMWIAEHMKTYHPEFRMASK